MSAGRIELPSVVMEFHHKEEVELCQNGCPNQRSPQPAMMTEQLLALQCRSDSVKFPSRICESNPNRQTASDLMSEVRGTAHFSTSARARDTPKATLYPQRIRLSICVGF